MKPESDEGIGAIRQVRARISFGHGNDAKRLVDHYLQVQVRYRERMLKEDVVKNQPGAVADAAPKPRPQDGNPDPGER